jgi:PAS domain S-box-containing protein
MEMDRTRTRQSDQAVSSVHRSPLDKQQIAELQTMLLELAHDVIIIRDPANSILWWNRGAEALYGWTEQEAIGQVTHVLLQTQFPVSKEALDSHLEQQESWEGELIHTSRAGKQITVESRQVLVRDEQGAPVAVLEINRDTTERKRLLTEQAETQARIQTAIELARVMDEFIGIVGHELRTPLTTIKASIQLARRQLTRLFKQQPAPPAEEQALYQIQNFLERAERQINMQNRLVGDLLDVSRIHTHQLELRPQRGDLCRLVRDVVEAHRLLAPTRTIRLTLPDIPQVPVLVDTDRVRQVLNNYLTNALKYSPADKPIEVRLEIEGSLARVLVIDQGPGLSEEEQQHVWERFYRVRGMEAKGTSPRGLGLGLYICCGIIERQGGQVGVDSRPGQGSTFWFTLPLASATDEEQQNNASDE